MPFKLNHDRRHHIAREKHRVTNLAAYDPALRQRGSLTVWFTTEVIAGWRAAPRSTSGEQPRYSPLAILTALTLRALFRLALRQTEGLIDSIIGLLGLALAVPDHSTLSRRAIRWSWRGADLLLQVRCAVYNGALGSGFGQLFEPVSGSGLRWTEAA